MFILIYRITITGSNLKNGNFWVLFYSFDSFDNHSDKWQSRHKLLGISWSKEYLLKMKKNIMKKSTSLFKHLRALSLKIKGKKDKKERNLRFFFSKNHYKMKWRDNNDDEETITDETDLSMKKSKVCVILPKSALDYIFLYTNETQKTIKNDNLKGKKLAKMKNSLEILGRKMKKNFRSTSWKTTLGNEMNKNKKQWKFQIIFRKMVTKFSIPSNHSSPTPPPTYITTKSLLNSKFRQWKIERKKSSQKSSNIIAHIKNVPLLTFQTYLNCFCFIWKYQEWVSEVIIFKISTTTTTKPTTELKQLQDNW